MRAGLIVVGVLVLTGATRAEDAHSRTVLATVDANGHVLPVNGRAAPAAAETVDGLASPCPAMTALEADAARDLVARIATAEGFEPAFALSVARIESHYGSTALSPRGAYGLMQLMPETAKRFAVDLCDPEGNVRGGIRFLRLLQGRYRNPFTVLAAYNAGEEAVRRARGVPPFPETVRFVADVMNALNGWPAVGDGRQAGEAPASPSSSSAPLLVEPQAPAPTATGATRTAADPGPWSAGFVMHIQ